MANVKYLNQSNLTKICLCHQLYSIFEQALVNDKVNLYTLRETFFSTEHHSPSLMFIHHQIEINGLQRDSKETAILWTSSSLFNPFLFMPSLPITLFIPFFMINIQTLPHHITLSLKIDTSETVLPLNLKEEVEVLSTMTAKIKAYAVAQSKLFQWDGSNNGYILPLEKPGIESMVFLIGPTIFLIMFSLVLLTFIVQMKQNIFTRTTAGKQYMFIVLHATGIIAFPFNAIEIFLSTKSCAMAKIPFQAFTVIKSSYLLASLIVATCFAYFGWKKAQTFPVNYCCAHLCCCFSQCPNLRQKLIYAFVFFNVSYLSFLLLISICPTLLLIFVYPSEVVSLLVALGIFLFSAIKFLASLLSYNIMMKSQVKGLQVQQSILTHLENVVRRTIYLFPLGAVAALIYFYIKILANTDYTGSSKLIQIGMSLLPSLILGIVGYFSRTWFQFFDKEIYNDDNSISDEKIDAELQKPQGQEKQLEADGDKDGSELEIVVMNNGNDEAKPLRKR